MDMSGAELRAWRQAQGLTQAQAAERFDMKQSAWANYESGNRAIPATLQAATVGEGGEAPAPRLTPAPDGPPALQRAYEIQAAVKAGTNTIRADALATGIPLKWAKALEKRGARRVTEKEAAADPINCSGPNVWTWRDAQGSVFLKFSASGQGEPSLRRPGDPGFIPNRYKDGGGSPKAPPAGRKKAA